MGGVEGDEITSRNGLDFFFDEINFFVQLHLFFNFFFRWLLLEVLLSILGQFRRNLRGKSEKITKCYLYYFKVIRHEPF